MVLVVGEIIEIILLMLITILLEDLLFKLEDLDYKYLIKIKYNNIIIPLIKSKKCLTFIIGKNYLVVNIEQLKKECLKNLNIEKEDGKLKLNLINWFLCLKVLVLVILKVYIALLLKDLV